MNHDLSPADEVCLQSVIGSLLVSSSLREALAAEGADAFRTHQADLATSITPGAWQAIRRIAPRTMRDMAVEDEHARRRRAQPEQARKRSDAA
jgi:hypothetical protein